VDPIVQEVLYLLDIHQLLEGHFFQAGPEKIIMTKLVKNSRKKLIFSQFFQLGLFFQQQGKCQANLVVHQILLNHHLPLNILEEFNS